MSNFVLFKRDMMTLANAGTIEYAEIRPCDGGFLLAIYLADRNMKILYTDRKKQREFKSLDAAYTMVSKIGLTEVTLKLAS